MESSNDIEMDSQEKFAKVISDHYRNIAEDNISLPLLDKLCNSLAEYYHEQYSRFRRQYPKSIGRYSTFQIKDLDHPQAFELVIRCLKEECGADYKEYSCLLLKMTVTELIAFEKNREEFWNMF